jgi:predicted enzyme related to lactoylglutathione lyase
MPNPVIRWQLISPEPDRAAGFYQKAFGWQLSQANALGYRELASGEARGIDGGVWPAPPGQAGFVQLFIEVENLAASIAAATRLGATVIIPESNLPDGDAMAVLLDPTGVSFGLCRLKPRS